MRVHSLALAMASAVAFSCPLFSQGNPWTNLGGGKPGRYGTPILTATPLQIGSPMIVRLASADRRSMAHFVFGFQRANQSLLGGTLVPSVDAVVSIQTDHNGEAAFMIPVPPDPKLVGASLFAQCVVRDPMATFSAAFSNALGNTFCSQLFSRLEDFKTTTFLDVQGSAGSWGSGQVTFSPLGGDGRHGVFNPAHGINVTPPGSSVSIFEWNTDSLTIPGTHTDNGKTAVVTDGRLYFSRMNIPHDVVVRFVGSNPARIWVQGNLQISGHLHADGRDIFAADARIQRDLRPQVGEPGGTPGCFGGRGGAGGDRGNGDGTVRTIYNGKPGDDVRLLAGHAYARRTANTGGKASPQHPAGNKNSSIVFSYFGVLALHMNRGGGGGGFTSPGNPGTVRWLPPDLNRGARYMASGTTAGGLSMLFPATFPTYTSGFTRQDHFLGGGSGGGGGGSSCGGAIKSLTSEPYWWIGRAGTGGGGALGFRIGRELRVASGGILSASGGAPAFDNAQFATRGMMTPGGAGAGGSLFLQISGQTRNLGEIRVLGGRGGATIGHASDTLFRGAESRGGSGSDGLLHFEVNSNPTNYAVGTTRPAPRAITRLDAKETDDLVGVRSLWYAASLLFPPTFLRYEIEAMVDGKAVLFSDDPKVGTLASGSASPLRFTIQGAQLERSVTGQLVPKPGTKPTIYTPFVGPFSATEPTLHGSSATGYRFMLTLDRSQGKTVVIRKVRVYWCL